MAKELEPAGTLTDNKSFTFRFRQVREAVRKLQGHSPVRSATFVRTSINRNYSTKIVKEVDFAVQLPTPELENEGQVPIKMEVGIEDCLHIEFEYTKSNYHLKDCLVGKVSFQLVKLKIKSMDISIERRETFGTGQTTKTEKETSREVRSDGRQPRQRARVVPIRSVPCRESH
jgi:vacuolar protein sorting-associated protein 26